MPSMQLIDNDTELYFSPSAKIASVGAFMQDSDSENNTFVTPSFTVGAGSVQKSFESMVSECSIPL